MVLKSKLKYSKVILSFVKQDWNSVFIYVLEKNIDGKALIKLTDDDIVQLFLEINEDGMLIEPTIGTKSRFRTKLMEWRMVFERENNK